MNASSLAGALLALALSTLACVAAPLETGGVGIPAANAAVATALAGGVAAERRHEGECYTPCTAGRTCNPKTGYCEALPCGGACREDERCDEVSLIPHCVPGTELRVTQPRDTSASIGPRAN